MKSKFWFGVLALLLLVALIGGCGGGQQQPASPAQPAQPEQPGQQPSGEVAQEKVTLRFANYFPGESGPGRIGQEFADDIKELTGGLVEVEYYPGGMLLGADKMYDGVMEGIADIGLSNLSYTFGRFKVTEVLDLPIGFPNAWVSNHVVSDFLNEFRPKEWEDTHVLTLHTSPVNNIITISTAVEKPEDLRGLILRAPGYIGKLVEALGGNPRTVPMPEAYDNLAKGVFEGLLIPYETVITFRYGEVTNHVTEVWPLGQVYTFYLVMNKNTWNKLSPDTQNIITTYIQDDFQEKLAQMWNRIDIEGKQYAIDSGYEIHEIAPSELGNWKGKAQTVLDDYIASMVAEGYSEAEVQGWIDYVRERIEFWSAKQKELGIKSSTGDADVLHQFD